jgi:hypothetical protein
MGIQMICTTLAKLLSRATPRRAASSSRLFSVFHTRLLDRGRPKTFADPFEPFFGRFKIYSRMAGHFFAFKFLAFKLSHRF